MRTTYSVGLREPANFWMLLLYGFKVLFPVAKNWLRVTLAKHKFFPGIHVLVCVDLGNLHGAKTGEQGRQPTAVAVASAIADWKLP